MKIISSLSEFDEIKNKKSGFIIISVQPDNSGTIHKVTCAYILKNRFAKIVNSISAKRNYLWTLSLDDVDKTFSNVHDCKQCNPLNKKLRFN